MKNYHLRQKYCKICQFLAIFTVLLLSLSCTGTAKSIKSSGLGTASDPIPFMEKAKTGILPSGLRYYLLENAKPEGRAYLTLAVNAGSVLEEDNERGLAHFVEHMAFNGTRRFPKSELVNYLRSLGMRFGPEVNAYTSFDETVYGIEVPTVLLTGETGSAGVKVIPDKALAVIDDWAWSVIFNPEDVDNERLVIMEEYRTRLGARERISREMYPLLFRGSPYAERLPIGIPEVIENAPAERLEGFYKKWYRPENMAVIIVGDFNAGYLEASLSEHFPPRESTAGGQAAGVSASFSRPRYNLSEPQKGSLLSLILTDDELSQERIDLYWKRKSEPRRGDLEYYRQSIINYLADTMIALRFDEARTKSETPYLNTSAGTINYGYSSRFYVFFSIAKKSSVKASLRELLYAKESLSRYGFTQDEADRAKSSLLSDLEQAVSEKDFEPSRDYVDSFTRHFLKGETVPDPEWELDAVTRLLPGITLKEINSSVKNYFIDDDLTVIISAPESEKGSLPNDLEIREIASEIRRIKIAPPSSAKTSGDFLEAVPEPGTIISEITDNETGAVRLLLGNGAELILKETKNKNSEISFYAQSRGGTLSVPDEMAVSASLAAEMLNVSGLGSYSRTELTKLLLDKQVSFSFWAQNYLRGFQGSAAVKDIKVLFEMLYLSFTRPRLDPEAVNVMIEQLRSRMAFEENDPNRYFSREISRIINENPRFHPLVPDDLEKADPEEALIFIQACLNPADYTFVFTGSVDLVQFRSLAETYLASIPGPSGEKSGSFGSRQEAQTFNEWANIDSMRPPDTEKEILKGREERSTVYMSWFRPAEYSEEKSAVVSVLSDYLDIVLTEEIREVQGGVYSISSWVSLSPIPGGELSGGAYFACDPRRAGELFSAVKEEFQKIAGGNIDVNVLEKAALALIKSHETSIQSNLYLAQSYANSAVIYSSPLSRLDKRPALFRSVKADDLREAAEELLEGSLVHLTLLPE